MVEISRIWRIWRIWVKYCDDLDFRQKHVSKTKKLDRMVIHFFIQFHSNFNHFHIIFYKQFRTCTKLIVFRLIVSARIRTPSPTFFTFETFVTNVQTLSIKTLCLLHLFREWQPNDVVNVSNTFFFVVLVFFGGPRSPSHERSKTYTHFTLIQNILITLIICHSVRTRKEEKNHGLFVFFSFGFHLWFSDFSLDAKQREVKNMCSSILIW